MVCCQVSIKIKPIIGPGSYQQGGVKSLFLTFSELKGSQHFAKYRMTTGIKCLMRRFTSIIETCAMDKTLNLKGE